MIEKHLQCCENCYFSKKDMEFWFTCRRHAPQAKPQMMIFRAVACQALYLWSRDILGLSGKALKDLPNENLATWEHEYADWPLVGDDDWCGEWKGENRMNVAQVICPYEDCRRPMTPTWIGGKLRCSECGGVLVPVRKAEREPA